MPPGEEAGRHRGRGSAANAGQRREPRLHSSTGQRPKRAPSLSISLLCVSLGVLVDFLRFICCFWGVGWG